MPKALFLFAVGLSSAALILPALADDWPEFRGPAGQGYATGAEGLPLTWSETENIAWKAPLDGLGWSSPCISGGRVYLTTAIPAGGDVQQLVVLCLAADSGDELWRREVFTQPGPVEIHGKNSHASSTPVVQGGRIYVHFGPHGTAALSLEGQVIWTCDELKYGPTHGNGGSPVLWEDRLIICCDGHDKQFVAAISTSDGSVLWRTERGLSPAKGFSFCTPLVITVDGRTQAICPGSSGVQAFDPASARELWRVRYGDGYSVVPRPLFAHGLVYVCTGYDAPELLAIDPTGSGDCTETHVRWRAERGAPHNPSPVIVGERLYCVSDNGVLSAFNARTGEPAWLQRLGGKFSASLLAAGDRVYAQDEHGEAIVFRPGAAYEELARNTFADGARTFASYAVSDGALFIRSESHLYRVEQGGASAKAD